MTKAKAMNFSREHAKANARLADAEKQLEEATKRGDRLSIKRANIALREAMKVRAVAKIGMRR